MAVIEIRNGVKVGLDEMLRGAAKLDTSALRKFVDSLETLLANRKVRNGGGHVERELLAVINTRFPADLQARFDALTRKLNAETINDQEHGELLELTKSAEQHNAIWLNALSDLARIKQLEVSDLLSELGIPSSTLKA